MLVIGIEEMPYEMGRDHHKGYFVMNMQTGKKYGHCESKESCEAQLRLLRALEHGFVTTQMKEKEEREEEDKRSMKKAKRK